MTLELSFCLGKWRGIVFRRQYFLKGTALYPTFHPKAKVTCAKTPRRSLGHSQRSTTALGLQSTHHFLFPGIYSPISVRIEKAVVLSGHHQRVHRALGRPVTGLDPRTQWRIHLTLGQDWTLPS